MNILIVEDERPAADKLIQLLKKIDPEIQVAGILETVENSVNWLRENPAPDLILMDIQLNDGICFEIFSVLKITTPVIFTTAYDEYAIRAFKVNSVDYLLKPIDLEALAAAIEKYKSLFGQKPVEVEKINHIFEGLIKNYRTRFLVKIGLHYNSVLTDDIECFCICERSTFLRTFSGKSYDLDYSLEQIQSMVDPSRFFRINRNYIVNINSITNILSYSTNRLKLKLNSSSDYDTIIVSRDKVSEFKEWLDR
jgi:DNA-binding LytR/AlgR family response regulator